MAKNIFDHNFTITKEERQQLNRHSTLLVWFTGLSGSGKSTIANEVEKILFEKNIHTYLLDGDNVRKGINSNLSFSAEDRKENIRRISEVAKIMMDAGLVVLASFVSPYRKDREKVKQTVGQEKYYEVFVNTPLEECEKRDVKGLYAKARRGEIKNFTGINAPYELPLVPDVEVDTTKMDIKEIVAIIVEQILVKITL